MKTIYHVYHCGDDCGEVEGMFDVDGKALDMWCCNDASWRNEYFAGFMREIGVNVVTKVPAKIRKICENQLDKYGV